MTIRLLSLIIAATSQLAFAAPSAADQAALDLIKRVIPAKAGHFQVDTSLPKQDNKDTFSVSDTADGKILLRGNNGVSVASAFNWYLKNRAQCHLSWCGDQLNLPDPLPKVGEPVTITAPGRHRVYFNYCTLSYSAAWWDWQRWQREIDFMAMNGINMPLSVIGLEAVWYETLLKYQFTDQEAREFLVGPGFFAWQWMSNIEGHGGPLPKSWIDSHLILGRQILERQRALGMTPIQQGFSGHVPRLLKEKYPHCAIELKKPWAGFQDGAAQLDPLDPLFDQMGRTFLEEQQRLFGTSHLYACDPFHEGHPPVKGDEYLTKVGNKIAALLEAHDPHYLWLMQSWSIRKAIATAVPKDRLLILDLGGRRHESYEEFWGYDFVIGPLHNFGGRTKLHGDLTKLATTFFDEKKQKIPNYAGTGFFMEGIIQNPVYYEMAFDATWRSTPVEPAQWLHQYARRRYGADSENARKAWDILLATAYQPNTDRVESSTMVCARPAVKPKKSGPNLGFNIPYEQPKLLEAWALLLADADKLKQSDAFLYDIVDVGREVLSNHAQTLQPRIRAAWEKRDLAAFDKAVVEFDQLLLDLDQLAGTRPELSLAKWVTDARSHGTTDAEKNLYEANARSIITVWGPTIPKYEIALIDYSWREWSGLIKDFYLPRWQQFHTMLRGHLVAGTEYSEAGLPQRYGHESFRANAFYDKLADWELAWATTPGPVASPVTSGDALALARRFCDQYAPAIQAEKELSGDSAKQFGKQAGQWSPTIVSARYQPLTFPVTNLLDGKGRYKITLRHTDGDARLTIASVELLEGEKPVGKDAHQGFAGKKHRDNTYTLHLPDHASGTDYALRITAKADGSTRSNGKVFLRKEP